MEKEHSELQQHISRTDWWCENLGHWRATITTAEVTATAISLELIRSGPALVQLGTYWGGTNRTQLT